LHLEYHMNAGNAHRLRIIELLSRHYITVLLLATDFSPVMILFAIPLFALGIGMIYVLKIRINEIRSGEEDDLSNY